MVECGLRPYHAASKESRDKILAAIRECSERLGRVPTYAEFRAMMNIGPYTIQAKCGGWTRALRACGMRSHQGSPLELGTLLTDWAGMVRKNGRLPTSGEYELETHHCSRALRRWLGKWANMPRAFADYAEKRGLKDEWADLLKVVEQQTKAGLRAIAEAGYRTKSRTGAQTNSEQMPADRTSMRTTSEQMFASGRLYGAAFTDLPMVFAPMNEMGVVLMFGALARKLGFIITWIGTAFPDGEATREVIPGKYQPVRIEFELESRNFLKHLHNNAECELIVCWVHNWPECPVEVVELSREIAENARDRP